MKNTRAILLALAASASLASLLLAQPATQPATPAQPPTRRIAPPRNITPGMAQDPKTGQYYTPMEHAPYAFGADISSTKDLESRGKVFKDNGIAKPVLQILQDHGYNYVRMRVCVPQASLPQTTAYTAAYAKEAKKMGFKFLLDFHYANGWADPRNEPAPREWMNKTHDQLVQLLHDYTKDTIEQLVKADAMPDIVQVGNEVSNGFVMPYAKLPENWDTFADLLKAGIAGINEGRGTAPMPRIMIHVDHGGDVPKTRAFFDKLNTYKVPFDIVGFSFYPWSHGTLMDLRANLAFTANTYNKDIIVVETGYYYTANRDSNFDVTPGPFPETPEGQAQWLTAVNDAVMAAPNGHGIGVFYWEPASNGGLTTRGYFDPQGNSEPILKVFDSLTRPIHRTDSQ